MNQIAETHSLIIMFFLGQVCDLISLPLNYGQKIKAATFDAKPYDIDAFLDIYNKIGKLLIESDEQYCELEKPHPVPEATQTRGFFNNSQNHPKNEPEKKKDPVALPYGAVYSSITPDHITTEIKTEVLKLRYPTPN